MVVEMRLFALETCDTGQLTNPVEVEEGCINPEITRMLKQMDMTEKKHHVNNVTLSQCHHCHWELISPVLLAVET